MKTVEILISLIIVFSFILTLIFYEKMPSLVESHWDFYGNVNGYMNKEVGIFLIPSLMIFMTFIFFLIPKIDPLGKNILKFINHYNFFIIIFYIFLFILQIYLILWNIGIKIKINYLISICLGFLFFSIGKLLEKTKRNWFIGIRTPWTLSSDIVWDKTNKFAGKLFKISSFFCILSVVFVEYSVFFVLFPIILSSIVSMVYSYIIYKKLR